MIAPKPVSIAILAAGESSRLRASKQLIKFQGKSLLRHIAEITSTTEASEVLVILGFRESLFRQELSGLKISIVENPNWSEGISSSIIAATRAVHANSSGILFLTVDQPFVSTELLNRIIHHYQTTEASIVACEYSGTVGIPALFDRSMFPELLQLTGGRGAKDIIVQHRSNSLLIPFPEGEIDIDTPDDLEKLQP